MSDTPTPGEHTPDPAPDAPPPRPRRSIPRRVAAWIGSGGLNLVLAILILAGVGFVAVRTALGNQLVVRAGIWFADGSLDGQIRFGEVRSANLLRGARILDVGLLTPGGDTLLVADSVEVNYRIRDLVAGNLVLSGLRVWGSDVRIEQDGTPDAPGPSTLQRFLASPDPQSGGGGGNGLVLDGIRLDDARIRVRRPTSASADGILRTVARGDGRDLLLEAEIERAVLGRVEVLPTGRGGTTVDLDELTATVHLLSEPVDIVEGSSELRISPSRIIADVRFLRSDFARVAGTVAVGLGGEPDVQLQLDVRDADLGALRWISPEIPAASGDFALSGRVRGSQSRWGVSEVELALGGGTVSGGGAVEFRDGLRFDSLRVALASVGPGSFDRWLPDSLRLPGRVNGDVTLDGPLESFRVLGRVGLRSGTRTSRGRVDGEILRTDAGVALRAFRVELDTLAWEMVRSAVPGFALTGDGTGTLTLSGSVEEGLTFDVDATHTRPGWPASHILAAGTARRADEWIIDVQGDASPLSLGTIRQDFPDLPVEGTLAGSFRARGPLSALDVETDLTGEFGRARLTVALNPARPADGVAIRGELIDFQAGRFLTGLGPRTSVTAEVDVRGSGSDLSTLEGEGRIRFAASRVQGVDIDSAVVSGRIASSDLRIDSLRGRVGGFDIRGEGRLAVDTLRPDGELRLTFATESLAELRPAFLGDTVIARDTLQTLEREVLILSGIDPDTLPLAAEVRFDGAVDGEVVLRGSVTDFTAEGGAAFRGFVRGLDEIASARVDLRATGLPGADAAYAYTVHADSAFVFGRRLGSADFDGTYRHPGGEVTARLVQQGAEELDLETGFTLEHGGVRAAVTRLDLLVDSTRYALQRPTELVWTDSIRSVSDLELLRDGPSAVRIRADGVLPWRGEADFELAVDRLDVARLLRLLQREELDADGVVDLDVRVTGMARSPIIEGTIGADSLRWGAARFDRVGGEVSYRDRSARVDLVATRDGEEVLDLGGSIPVDLALVGGVERFPAEALDLRVRTRELPARSLLGWLEDLEQIEGAVTGDFSVAGTVADPEASGELRLTGGAWTLGSIGVRQTGVEGTLRILPDGRLAVDAVANAGGTARTTGTIELTPLTDPTFDLEIVLDRFVAVDRLDVTGSVSGDLTLTGRFRRPVLGGDLEVDEGTLFLDEFQRSIGVLDLSDPRFTSIVDTTDIGGRALLSRTQNPFMDGLSVNILMDVESNTWLRGRDLQVEIVGQDIIVVYDRQERDLSLFGDFTVQRGQAFFGSRAFDVETGTVSFLGTPGINPEMDIRANTRVRRQDGDPLDIGIQIDGTLLNPRIQPTTDEQGLSESDLYSYIVFGQPTSSLTRGTLSGSNLGAGGAVLGAAGSWLSGTVANQLAALASQELSLVDYLAISQVGDFGLSSGLQGGVGSSFASTQVEVGRYFSNGEIFGALVLRPLSQLGASTNVIGGARMEWQSSDLYHLEAFVEDRFLRASGFGLSELSLGSDYVIGFALIREWGY